MRASNEDLRSLRPALELWKAYAQEAVAGKPDVAQRFRPNVAKSSPHFTPEDFVPTFTATLFGGDSGNATHASKIQNVLDEESVD